jgi:hypothetical protein
MPAMSGACRPVPTEDQARKACHPLSTVSMPASARMASNRPGNLPSRSPDQEPRLAYYLLKIHDQVPRGLGDPGRTGMRGRGSAPATCPSRCRRGRSRRRSPGGRLAVNVPHDHRKTRMMFEDRFTNRFCMPSALAAGEVATTPSAARSVWASPLYRGATVALFLSGLGTSAAAPQITCSWSTTYTSR